MKAYSLVVFPVLFSLLPDLPQWNKLLSHTPYTRSSQAACLTLSIFPHHDGLKR